MAPFSFLSLLTISATIFLFFFPCLTSSSSSSSTIIPTSPAFLGNSPPQSSFEQLSPDIAPLLPSPGGKLPSPSVASLPTIPSNPNLENPDELAAAQGPAPAFAPMEAPPPASTSSLLSKHTLANLAAPSLLCIVFLSMQIVTVSF